MSEVTLLSINGMSCAGCVRTVENALSDLPDVASATVNFADQTAAVRGEASLMELIAAVEKAGYTAKRLENHSIEEQEEDIRREFASAIIKSGLSLACGALLMANMWLGLMPPLTATTNWILVAIVTLGIAIFAGGHFYRGAFNAALNRSATMDTLIALGTGSAWLFSVIVILFPEAVPVDARHQYFEATLFIIGFVNLGKALESNARSRASLAIQKLFDLTPKMALRLVNDKEELVAVEQLLVGDQLVVKPGDNVPVDGVVVTGNSSLDESMLTGESEPVLRGEGDIVRAGTINTDGHIVINATGVGAQTMLANMVRLVREAQNSKPPVARLVDQITAVFVPAVVLVAIATSVIWMTVGPEPRVSYALVTAMSVLIIACPCALGLAIPMSIMVGLGRAAASGLLVRNSEVLQKAAGLDVVVMDKTGTLTIGKPVVVNVVDIEDPSLALAAGLATNSGHPLSVGIVKYCLEKDIQPSAVAGFTSQAGGGVSGEIDGRHVALGNHEFMRSVGYDFVDAKDTMGTIVYFGIEQKLVGYFLLKDEPRLEAEAVIQQLHDLGIRTAMLTGDRQSIAQEVAAATGIDEVHANLLPEDKLQIIRAMQERGEVVGMVGDGINDAAALSIADVGFAMGKGTDVAMESADVTLLGDSLLAISRSVDLSRSILKNIRQNLFAAFFYNLALIPVAAGALYPFTGILIDPALAGFAMAMSSVTVVFNAGRLRFS
jgi:Cu+-exporting ATPase